MRGDAHCRHEIYNFSIPGMEETDIYPEKYSQRERQMERRARGENPKEKENGCTSEDTYVPPSLSHVTATKKAHARPQKTLLSPHRAKQSTTI